MPAGSAAVVGGGHNGLVAAIMLADAGWDVVVLEEQERLGGAVFSDRSMHPEFVTDWYSAFYPLGAASPVLSALDLDSCGLQWSHAPQVLAHVLPDDRCAVLSRDLDTTAASLDAFGSGDGDAWRTLVADFERMREPLLRALFSTFPPVRGAAGLARALGAADLLRFVRFAVQPVRRAGDELFAGEGGKLLLAGNALHTDLPPEAAGSALYGWLLAMLGQTVGFPVPVGGSGAIVSALERRLTAAGGTVRTGAPVRRFEVAGGAVRAVRLEDGERIAVDAVLADLGAPLLYERLLDPAVLPDRLRDDLRRFQWDYATFKVDWALRAPVPWTAAGAATAGTVHVAASMDEMTEYTASIAMGRVPARPFLLVGQMTTSDPSRSPAGTESLWAYTHVPRQVRGDAGDEGVTGSWDERDRETFAARIEAQLERYAPGFRDLVVARTISAPPNLQEHNANLVGGAINGGTTAPHQQLFFRPTPALGRPETPVAGLYLASSSAHPGGAVHGACGSNAARAALRASRGRYQQVSAAVTRYAIGR